MVLVPGPTTGIRRRNVYRDFESWQKAHSEWQAQLVPEARSVQYWSGVGVVILSLVLWSAIVGGASHLIARMSVHNTSEGMRRLAIFVGTIATVVWVAFVALKESIAVHATIRGDLLTPSPCAPENKLFTTACTSVDASR